MNNYDDIILWKAIRYRDNVKKDQEEKTKMRRT
jgi:hypothetical protein